MQQPRETDDRPIPRIGETFELTLNGDKVDPVEMVTQTGRKGLWKYLGNRISGTQTRRFKLVDIGACRNMAVARERAGSLADGLWAEAFRAAYPLPGDARSVCFGGSGWLNPYGLPRIALLENSGVSWTLRFENPHTVSQSEGVWLWLTEVTS